MSNPFATFRKNQTYWMAALVLIAILSFIIAPAIDMVTRSFRGGGGSNQVIAKWDGGRITQAEVDDTLSKRVALRNFLTSLAKKVIAAGGSPAVPGFAQFNGQIFSLGVNDNLSTETVAMTKIMLTQAKKMGVEFDDVAADEFLKEFCNGKIADSEFNELLKTNNLTIFEVRELIKQDLTTTTAEELVMGGRNSPSPGKLWQNFLKLNQTAKVEVYQVLANSFMDKVTAKPTEAQLQELYEAGKNRAADPNSPDAGFLKLDQANVEYVMSNYTTWFESEKAKVTEDDLKAEYEKQLAAGLLKVPMDYKAPSTETPGSSDPSAPAVTDPATPAVPAEATAPATETPAAPAAETPAVPATPAAETPAAPAADSPAPAAADSPAPVAPDAPAGNAPAVPADNPQGALNRADNNVRLVSYVQEDTPAATQETPAVTEAPAAPAETAPSATVQQDAPASTVTEPTATTTAPAEQPPADPVPANSPAVVEGDIAVAEPGKPATPQMRDMTFEEARERLLRTVADDRASKLSGEALTKLQKTMRDYYLANRQYQTLKNADVATRQVKQPERPDLKKFAQENGLEYGETGLGDSLTLSASQFGRSVVLNGNQGMGLAAEIATMAQLETFAPLQSQFQGQDAYYVYFFWKTEAKPAFVPPLSDIRDQVEDAWRRIESRKFAEEAAQALLKKVGSGETPWAGALSETEQSLVVGTEQFTWLSRLGGEIRLTDVAKLDRVGDDFMKQVFSTEAGKFGVAANNSKSVYYVFRVLEKAADSELQARFNSDPIRQGPNQIANNEMRAAVSSWRNKVIEELNVQFP